MRESMKEGQRKRKFESEKERQPFKLIKGQKEKTRELKRKKDRETERKRQRLIFFSYLQSPF